MPIDYTIDTLRGMIRTRVTGRVTYEDMLANFRRQRDDPAYAGCMLELADVRGITPDITSAELRDYSDLVHRHVDKLPQLRIAVLVDDDLTFGMARMFSSLVEDAGRDVEVFRSPAEAEAWLAESPAATNKR